MKTPVRFVVIGGSAGSLQVILKILQYLKEDFWLPSLLVVHRNMHADNTLEELLSSKTKLTVREIEEKDLIKPGHLYLCPPNYHVLIENDQSFSLDASERIHHSRPSIDIVFSSAADIYGEGLLCILLSGANADGAGGIQYAKERGGITVVQDPKEAEFPSMPEQALKKTNPDYVLNANEIAGLLNSLEF